MNQQERDKIISLLALLSEQSPQPASKTRIMFTVEQLAQHSAPRVIQALTKLVLDSRRFPTVSEILSEMGIRKLTDRDLALQSSALIMGAIRKYGGWGTNEEVSAFVGPLAWKVIQKQGGWNALCDVITNQNESYVIRDLKDRAESLLRIDSAISDETKVFLSAESRKSHLRLVSGHVAEIEQLEGQ